MIIISLIIISIYAILILDLYFGINKVPDFTPQETSPKNRFSVIIPFRNEAENLPGLLKSISLLHYPKEMFEVILVNDDSSDDYQKVIETFQDQIEIKLINNQIKSGSPKKDAVEKGVQAAKYKWIVTTDADCIVPENWLVNFSAFIETGQPEMIVAPVAYKVGNTFLDHFQNLDFLSLQGSTIGGFGIKKPFLCNGANLCYSKQTFLDVDGYSGNEQISSGDDLFLMEKILKRDPNAVRYLKSTDSVVYTKVQPGFDALKEQRIRWAAKTGSSSIVFGKITGLIVFLTSFYLVLLFIMAAFHLISWQHFGLFFLIKFNVDFVLLYRTAMFFKQPESLNKYMTASVLYPVFVVYIAVLSTFRGFTWKGRKFKK